jgi:hypothetical protein
VAGLPMNTEALRQSQVRGDPEDGAPTRRALPSSAFPIASRPDTPQLLRGSRFLTGLIPMHHTTYLLAISTFLAASACGGASGDPPGGAGAAARDTLTLSRADLVSQPFDRVRAAAALDDSTLLLTDQELVYRLHLASGRLDSLGRNGEGPGEYRNPVAVGPLRGGRVAALGRALALASWLPDGSSPDRVQYPATLTDGLYTTFDSFGVMLGSTEIGAAPERAATIDTFSLVRFEAVGAVDTIGTVEVPAMVRPHPSLLTRPLYAATDAWGITAAGDVWMLRGRDFVPRWRRRGSAEWVEGAPWAWTAEPTAERDARYFDPPNDTVRRPMAAVKGPFASALTSPDGTIWARLHATAENSLVRYALLPIDSSRPRRLVILPAGRRVIAIGQRAVFASVEREDGTWTIERYLLPESMGE